MKKTISTGALALLLCGLLAAPAGAAAEKRLPELPEFYFASGAGAWCTELVIHTDGTFEGSYHDSNMGESGPGYNSTVYLCSFSGRLTGLKQVDAYTWSMRVETLTLRDEEGKEWVEDGVKYIASGPYGMPAVGGELRLYLPGHPTDAFSQELLSWARSTGAEPKEGKLTTFVLHNVSEEQAFSSSEEDSARRLPQWTAFKQEKIAYASTQTISVDGWRVEFQAYALKDEKGNDTNYIKLRDLASILDVTQARFEVRWDGAVNILTDLPYTPNGSEMKTPVAGNRTYEEDTTVTRIDGQPVELSTILLKDDKGNGYTYYKLRDLGDALGFTVGWSAGRGIYIETEGAG